MGKGFRLVGIKVVNKPNGKRYIYRRVRGKFIQLPNLPENHPEFLRAYLEAGKVLPKNGLLGETITAFLASQEFHERKESTRRVWRRRLDYMSQNYGKAPTAQITTEQVEKALRKISPGAAKGERTIWRALFSFAKAEFIRPDNPAKDAEIRSTKAVPHATWTADDIATFRAHWPLGTSERQCFEVIFWTAARCIDAAVIGWQCVDDGVLEFVQEKTNGTAVVPITAPVAPFLESDRAMFLKAASPDMLFILSGWGKGRSVKALSQLVSRAAREAGLQNRTAHGLRRARAVILAENGWTPHQIGAWTGHESLAEVVHYTKDANKRALVVGNQSGNLIALNANKPYK
jgi:integrase